MFRLSAAFAVLSFATVIFAMPAAASAKTIFLTSGSSWTVPGDWNNSNNTIEVIGGGGGGGGGQSAVAAQQGAGGGGGAYSKVTNTSLTPGDTVIYAVGSGGSRGIGGTQSQGGDGGGGGNSWFDGSSCGNSIVCAEGGDGGSGGAYQSIQPGGLGGEQPGNTGGIGSVMHRGGNGGTVNPANSSLYSYVGGGGGGAAGPEGNGGNGGNDTSCGMCGGSGGGGAGGSSAGVSGNGRDGSIATTQSGATGGGNSAGSGSGAGGDASPSAGSAGVDGGGGGGGGEVGADGAAGGNGGNGKDWDSIHGAGGGGGSGGRRNVSHNAVGGNGGLYGGGGAGGAYASGNSVSPTGANGGSGAPGIVVITYGPATAPTCSISFDDNPITAGDSTIIHWTSSGAETLYINNIGYVNGSGETRVQPSQTTTYSGTASGAGGDAACTGESKLTVIPAAPQCIRTCPSGYTLQGNECVLTSCPQGYTVHNGQCVSTQCPVVMAGCSAGLFCKGTDVWHRDAFCAEAFDHSCPDGCSAGACVPTYDGNITASPSLISSGKTVTINWNTTGMRAGSCNVSGSNGDGPWSGASSSHVTSSLTSQTTYTLSCRINSNGNSFTDTVNVNIIPAFQEL